MCVSCYDFLSALSLPLSVSALCLSPMSLPSVSPLCLSPLCVSLCLSLPMSLSPMSPPFVSPLCLSPYVSLSYVSPLDLSSVSRISARLLDSM